MWAVANFKTKVLPTKYIWRLQHKHKRRNQRKFGSKNEQRDAEMNAIERKLTFIIGQLRNEIHYLRQIGGQHIFRRILEDILQNGERRAPERTNRFLYNKSCWIRAHEPQMRVENAAFCDSQNAGATPWSRSRRTEIGGKRSRAERWRACVRRPRNAGIGATMRETREMFRGREGTPPARTSRATSNANDNKNWRPTLTQIRQKRERETKLFQDTITRTIA